MGRVAFDATSQSRKRQKKKPSLNRVKEMYNLLASFFSIQLSVLRTLNLIDFMCRCCNLGQLCMTGT